MLAKHIKPKAEGGKTPHYNYAGLAHYIADTKNDGKKLHDFWMVNCEAGDSRESLETAIVEIKSTQKQNTRATSDKSYHLMVSFRQEDTMPSEEALRDIERHFAKALGFDDHQRVVGVHKDTDNIHMHIGYNRVHPETFKCQGISHDYKKLEKTCREMEKKHGLAIDLGRADKEEPSRVPAGAADMEAHRWEESFIGYVKRHKEDLKGIVSKAKTWQDVHEGFAEYDLEFKKHANGLVIASKVNKKLCVKASRVDRGFSKPSLEKRFGAFQTPNDGNKKKTRETYKPRPTTKHKGQERLWKAYRATPKAWYKGWKAFLIQMATIQDPLAIAIIQGQKMILRSLFDGKPSISPRVSPVASRKPQRPQPKPSPPRTYFPDIRSSEAKEAKKRGARWDKEKKQWYAGSKEALIALTVMKSPLAREKKKEEQRRQRIEERIYLDVIFEDKDKAKNAGARWNNEKRSWYASNSKFAKDVVSASKAVKSGYQKQRELNTFASGLRYQSFSAHTIKHNQLHPNIRSAVMKSLEKDSKKDKGLEL